MRAYYQPKNPLKSIKHKLLKEDRELFERMEGQYRTAAESEFFKKIRYKQEYVMTSANDLILFEDNNPDGVYIVRCWYEEYVVGNGFSMAEEHYMSLHEALSVNLKEIGVLDEDITLFDWLRKHDYAGVEYDHNYDDL